MTFDPYTQFKTIIVNEDGSTTTEVVQAPAGYRPSLNLQEAHDYKWKAVRAERDRLLADSDWVVISAAERGEPVPDDWLAYRQALRDVTSSLNPFLIEWPVKPTSTAAKRRIYSTDAPEETQIQVNETRI